MNKPGVTLIELVLALALSGMVAATLYNIFFIVTRGITIAEPMIDNVTRTSLVYNRLKKDLQGVFVPTQADVKATPSPQGPQATSTGQPTKVPEKPLDKVMYSINKNNSWALLSFITNNPLLTYYDPTKGIPKPAIARVVYRLESKPDGSFSLMRQESPVLNFEAFESTSSKPIRGYELANNIKNISMEYAFPVQDQKQGGANADKAQAIKFETRSEWRFDEWNKKEPGKTPRIPQRITMTMNLWDTQRQQESVFVFKFEITTFTTAAAAPRTPPSAPPADTVTTTTSQPAKSASSESASPVDHTPSV
jgi:prepilin-type N-terminal cleavage/methylation domain-containing protein